MRIEMTVDLVPKARRRQARKRKAQKHLIPRTRDRQLRWLALALHIEALVMSGQVKSYAEIARMCGVSRARVSIVLRQLWDEM